MSQFIPIQYSDSVIQIRSYKIPIVDGSTNLLVNPDGNSIDTDAGIYRSSVLGGGGLNVENAIGRVAKPKLAHPSPPAEWADDSGYPADGIAGSVATIGGGYDNVNNQIAGTICGGGHNYIKYNVDGHSLICGGSYNVISGARGYIGGGRYHVVTANFGTIVGGENNRVSGANSYIGCGSGNVVSGAGSAVSAGLSCTVSGLYSLAQGNTLVLAGDYSIAVGNAVNVDGAADYAAAFGQSHDVDHTHCLVSGQDVKTIGSHAHYIGGDSIAEVGDAQTITQVVRGQTTNDTLTTITGGFSLDTSKVTTGICKITLVGQEDGTPTNTVTLSKEFAFILNGSSSASLINLSDGSITTSSGPTLSLDVHRDDITVGTCQLRMTLGALLVRVTGKAATTINWVGRLEAATTLT